LPLFPTAIEQFDFKEFDLILSSSHCVAKGVISPPGTLHISYLHTPMRYVWDMYHEYFGGDKIGFFGKMTIPFFANYLRGWDASSSPRVDHYLANSRHVARRIMKYYRRESDVIYPPVDTSTFQIHHSSDDYFLAVSALVPYKRIELAILAFNKIKKRLIVIGNGPDQKRLYKLAGPTIEFVDWQPPSKLSEFYSKCQALIFPGEEDFGIVPVEAMASGKPVIAYQKGGALETVIGLDESDKMPATGVFFPESTVDSMIKAINSFEKFEWDPDFIGNHARKFDKKIFAENIQKFIQSKTSQFFN
jgi:glycosyltransferase involved in cell wall biosynthesis